MTWKPGSETIEVVWVCVLSGVKKEQELTWDTKKFATLNQKLFHFSIDCNWMQTEPGGETKSSASSFGSARHFLKPRKAFGKNQTAKFGKILHGIRLCEQRMTRWQHARNETCEYVPLILYACIVWISTACCVCAKRVVSARTKKHWHVDYLANKMATVYAFVSGETQTASGNWLQAKRTVMLLCAAK